MGRKRQSRRGQPVAPAGPGPSNLIDDLFPGPSAVSQYNPKLPRKLDRDGNEWRGDFDPTMYGADELNKLARNSYADFFFKVFYLDVPEDCVQYANVRRGIENGEYMVLVWQTLQRDKGRLFHYMEWVSTFLTRPGTIEPSHLSS
jgi:hypothetical protein